MQTSSRFFDDLAKVANSAVSTLAGVKGEIEAMVNQRLERFLADMDVVPRDEFDATKAVAVKARAEQEKLERSRHPPGGPSGCQAYRQEHAPSRPRKRPPSPPPSPKKRARKTKSG